MDYYTLLNLTKEPFSNSPDPEMFFQSAQHQGCLQKLEMAIRLQRGLSVVIGDIGTGKSTLCRQLIQKTHTSDNTILTHLILDPEFNSPLEFLQTIVKTLTINTPPTETSIWQLKDAIKNYLFEQAVTNKKIPVLIIDEGQKLPDFGVEILRELLNYETNQHKLLQIVIFAQEEFQEVINKKANFTDRITTYFKLTPLSFTDSKNMIQFRLQCAAVTPKKTPKLFSSLAIVMIYLLSKGYPRKIVMLCSKVVLAILIKNTRKAGVMQVIHCARETALFQIPRVVKLSGALVTVSALLIISIATINQKKDIRPITPTKNNSTKLSQQLQSATAAEKIAALQKNPRLAQNIQPAAASAPLPKNPYTAKWQFATHGQLPATLGTLPLQKGTNLSKMIARIYGRYNPQRLNKVLAATPNITDINIISPGTPITFPTLSSALIPPTDEFFVELAVKDSLPAAYKVVTEYPQEEASSIRIIPVIKDTKVAFLVALENTLTAKNKDTKVLARLPKAQH